jgi:hypothetical protein
MYKKKKKIIVRFIRLWKKSKEYKKETSDTNR